MFESFNQFIKDSNTEKYKATRIMSDHDSTFTSSQFEETWILWYDSKS